LIPLTIEDISLATIQHLNSGKALKDPFDANILQKFGLSIVGGGVTRTVYRQKYSRRVFKVGDFYANRYEFCLWEIFKPTQLGLHLAKCLNISADGGILEQEYVSQDIPGEDSVSLADWGEFQNDIEENVFDFSDEVAITDLHPSNLKLTPKGDVKIVDYSACIPQKFFSKKFNYLNFIKTNRKLANCVNPSLKFFVNAENEIVVNLDGYFNKLKLIYESTNRGSCSIAV
jgi:hypothetical protein